MYAAIATNDIAAKTISVAVSIALGVAGWGYWALVVGACALPLSTAIGAWRLCRWMPGRPCRVAGIREMLLFAAHTYGRFCVNYVARNTDNVLIGWRFGAFALGFYKKAYDLFGLSATQLVSSTFVVAVATLSRVREDRAQYCRYLCGAMAVLAFIGMGLSGDLTLVGKDLIRIILGPKWGEAGYIFTFFAPGIGGLILYTTHGWIHLSIGKAGRWLIWGIVEMVVTCALFVASLPWGPKGMAVAWCVSFWILFVPAMWYAGKPIDLGIGQILTAIWRYVVASIAAGVATLVIFARIPYLATLDGASGAAVRLSCVSVCFLILYLAAIVVLYGGYTPLETVLRVFLEMIPRRGPVLEPLPADVTADSAVFDPQTAKAGGSIPAALILDAVAT